MMKPTLQKLTTGLLWISVTAFMLAMLLGPSVMRAKLEESTRQRDIQHQKDLQVMASNLVRGMIEVAVVNALDKEFEKQLAQSVTNLPVAK